MDKRFSSELISFINFDRFVPLSKTHVLSTYKIVNISLDTLHISFIFKMQSKGPKMEPCGTPQSIRGVSD